MGVCIGVNERRGLVVLRSGPSVFRDSARFHNFDSQELGVVGISGNTMALLNPSLYSAWECHSWTCSDRVSFFGRRFREDISAVVRKGGSTADYSVREDRCPVDVSQCIDIGSF